MFILSQLLVALVSSYRYEGTKVHEDVAKSEAKTLSGAIKNGAKKNPMEDDDVVRILSTRSKPHLVSVFKHYKDISGKTLDEVPNNLKIILPFSKKPFF